MPTVPAPSSKASPPSLSAALCGLLNIVARGARRDETIHARAQCPADGGVVTPSAAMIPVHTLGRLVPLPLLTALERSGWGWSLFLATRRGQGLDDLEGLAALSVSFTVPAVVRNPDPARPPDYPRGRRRLPDVARLNASIARADGLLEASAVLVSDERATVVWALSAPLDVHGDAGQVAAVDLLRQLAAALDADPAPDVLADAAVPLPGFRAAGCRAEDVVDCLRAEPARVYSLEQVKAALAAVGRK